MTPSRTRREDQCPARPLSTPPPPAPPRRRTAPKLLRSLPGPAAFPRSTLWPWGSGSWFCSRSHRLLAPGPGWLPGDGKKTRQAACKVCVRPRPGGVPGPPRPPCSPSGSPAALGVPITCLGAGAWGLGELGGEGRRKSCSVPHSPPQFSRRGCAHPHPPTPPPQSLQTVPRLGGKDLATHRAPRPAPAPASASTAPCSPAGSGMIYAGTTGAAGQEGVCSGGRWRGRRGARGSGGPVAASPAPVNPPLSPSFLKGSHLPRDSACGQVPGGDPAGGFKDTKPGVRDALPLDQPGTRSPGHVDCMGFLRRESRPLARPPALSTHASSTARALGVTALLQTPPLSGSNSARWTPSAAAGF